MIYLKPLGWVDTWSLSAALNRARDKFRTETSPGVRVIRTRHDGEPGDIGPVRILLNKARRLIIQQAPQFVLVGAQIEQFEPRAVTNWDQGHESGAEIAVHIGLVTNPMAVIFSGNEGSTVAVGQVVAQDLGVMHSAINLGDTPRLHFVLFLKKPALPAEDEE
jgi:hypothetical protein